VKIIKEEEEEEEKDICFLLRITARAPPADCVALFPFWPERDYADILVVHQSFFFFFPSRLHLPFISLQTKCLPKKMGFPYTRKTNLVEEEKLNWLQNVWNSQEGLKKNKRAGRRRPVNHYLLLLCVRAHLSNREIVCWVE
jgi:hypothetical protein